MTYPIQINAEQAAALHGLMAEGRQAGATLPGTRPPRAIGLGSYGDPLEWEGVKARTLLVVDADDGRMWQIVTAGIAWPQSSVVV